MYIKKIIIFISLFFSSSLVSLSQIDSLKKIIPGLSNQEKVEKIHELIPLLGQNEKLYYFNELGELYRLSQTEKSFHYTKKALFLAEKLGVQKEKSSALIRMASLYFSPRLKYDSAEFYIIKALAILEKEPISNSLGKAYNIAGIIQADQGKLEAGLAFFNKAEKTYLETGNFCRAAVIHHNIGKLNKYAKGLDVVKAYFLEALEMLKDNNCEEKYDFLYFNLGEIYLEEGKYELARKTLLQALGISEKYHKKESIGAAYLALGDLNMKMDSVEAKKYYFHALEIADSNEIVKLQIAANIRLAKYFLLVEDFGRSKNHMDITLDKAQRSRKLNYIQDAHELLFQYYQKTNDFKKAFRHQKLYSVYKDSIGAEKVRVKIVSLEKDKRENQIDLLNKENEINELNERRSRRFSYFLTFLFLIAVIVFYIFFRSYRQKQEMKKMQIMRQSEKKLLDMEKQILSTVIETEDKERKRFAADLHDGLGPLLSGMKLYVEGINHTSGKEKESIIAQVKQLIDQSIQDIRNISRNIMPESIAKRGLIPTLTSFVNRIKFTKVVDINLTADLSGNQYNKGFEIIIFRIIAELINNTIKHAEASLVSIDIMEKDKQLIIIYKDDGKGFDFEKEFSKMDEGLGLKNLIDRVNSMEGKIKFTSEIGQGVKVKIILKPHYA